jgi:DNA-binding beta-propeller fold protein YncE
MPNETAPPAATPAAKSPSRRVPSVETTVQPRVDWTGIVNALKGIGSSVTGIASGVVSGNLPAALAVLEVLLGTPGWLAVVAAARALGFKTIGIVGGGEGALIVGGQGMLGILTGTEDTSHYYFYKNMGISIGVQEGAVVTGGLYLHSEEPKDDWCIELFSSLGGTLVEGVSVEVFTTVDTGSGAVLLMETGEEIKVNFGASVATWSSINNKPDLRIDTTVYVVDSRTLPSTVTPIPTMTSQPGPAVSMPSADCGYQVGDITPEGGTLYVIQKGFTTVPRPNIVPISLDLVTPEVGTPFVVQMPNISGVEQPNVFAISPDGDNGYLLPLGEAWLIPIALATNKPGTPISLPWAGWAMAIAPDGETAYVASPAGVVPVNLESGAAGAQIPGAPAYSLVITPDGETVYVSTQYQGTYTITPITIATNTPGTPIQMSTNAQSMAVTPDGETLYVSTNKGVLPLNIATNTFGTAIAVGVGRLYTALAITPDGQTLYALYQTFDAVTNPTAGSELVPISTTTNKPGTAILLNDVKNPTGIAIAL